MRRLLCYSVLAMMAAIGVFSAYAQSGDAGAPPRKVVSPPDTPVKLTWPEISLNVLALDKARHPEASLGKTDFQIRQDGVSQTIQAIAGADTPVSLGLMIDVSSSTYNHRQPITDAAIALVKGLPPGSELMAVLFADEGFLDVPFVPVSAIDSEYVIRHLESRGSPALFDSLIAANSYFASHAHERRRAIVLISDGGEESSAKTMNDAAHAMLTYRSPLLYVLGCRTRVGNRLTPGRRGNGSRSLAGFRAAWCITPRTTTKCCRSRMRFPRQFATQYALTFTSSDPNQNGQVHKLEVKVTRGGGEVYGLPQYLAPNP